MILKRTEQRFDGADAGAAAGAVVAAWVDGEGEEAADAVGRVELVDKRAGDDTRHAVFLVVRFVDPWLVDWEFGETMVAAGDHIGQIIIAVARIVAVAAFGEQSTRLAGE